VIERLTARLLTGPAGFLLAGIMDITVYMAGSARAHLTRAASGFGRR
jgi:hypothetical protein